MKSKEADPVKREDTHEKVEYDQYAVFAEQRHLNDLKYSQDTIQGEA